MKVFRKFIDKDLTSVSDENGKLSVFALAFPLFFDLISSHLIGLIQTMMASRFAGGFFVVPISVANTVLNFLSVVMLLVSTGMSILLSIYIGKKEKDACREIVGATLGAISLLALLLTAVGIVFAEPLLLFMGMNKAEYAAYMPYAITYLRGRCCALVLSGVGTAFIAALRCYGFTKVGLFCGLVSNLLNVIATMLAMFVFRMSKEIAMEILSGLYFGTMFVYVLLALVIFRKKKIGCGLKNVWKWSKKIFGYGAPASVSSVFYNLSQMVTTTICLSLAPEAYLAKTYISQIVYFVYLMGYSIGQANSIMLGRLCGMGDWEKADKMHLQNLRIVLLINVSISLLFAVFGKGLTRLIFNADDTVLAFVPWVLFIDVFVECGRGMNHIGQFGLNATGDVHFTTVVSVFSCWACSVGLAYLFGIVFGWGLYGVWAAFAVDELFRGTLYLVRWKKKGWQKRLQKGI